MDCSCEIDASDCGDYEPCAFINEKSHVARKPHRCSECRRTIAPGERYQYISGKWGGSLDVFKVCSDCEQARAVFFTNGYPLGAIWDEISSLVYDTNGDIPEACISRLTPRAREKVCEWVEDAWMRYEKRH